MKHPYLEAILIFIISVAYLLIVAPVLTVGGLFLSLLNMELRIDFFQLIWSWPLRLARGDD